MNDYRDLNTRLKDQEISCVFVKPHGYSSGNTDYRDALNQVPPLGCHKALSGTANRPDLWQKLLRQQGVLEGKDTDEVKSILSDFRDRAVHPTRPVSPLAFPDLYSGERTGERHERGQS